MSLLELSLSLLKYLEHFALSLRVLLVSVLYFTQSCSEAYDDMKCKALNGKEK